MKIVKLLIAVIYRLIFIFLIPFILLYALYCHLFGRVPEKAKFGKEKQLRVLLYFGVNHLEDMLKKGNVWYVRHYEAYFDKVFVVYLCGNSSEPVVNGNTTLISLGTGNGYVNILASPLRLYRFSKKIKPTTYLTADQVFLWWTGCLIKLLLKAKIYLMPVCMPEEIYSNTGKSLSRLPIWIERRFIFLSFLTSSCLLTGRSFGSFTKWLSSYPLARNKLCIVDNLVDALPSKEFFESLKIASIQLEKNISKSNIFTLIYIGRLHREKLVMDLIMMMEALKRLNRDESLSFLLRLIGDGPERDNLKEAVKERNLHSSVEFVGAVESKNLPQCLLKADVFVSTITGTSLREAALCGLPIVAYNIDWVVGLLEHEKNALLVPPRDYEEMARQVIRLAHDHELKQRLSMNIKELAWKLWSPVNIKESLTEAFSD